MLRFIYVLDQIIQNLTEVILTIFTRKSYDILENDSIGPVRKTSPHSHQLIKSKFYRLRSILDVSIPNLVSSHSGHLQFVIFNDIDCHEATIVCIGLLGTPRVVHMAFYDVKQFSDKDNSCVSLFPVVLKDPIAERTKKQVSVSQAVIVD